MAKSIWNPADRQALLARFDALKPNMSPVWGKMSVSQMVQHCKLPILAAMGEGKVTQKWTPFRIWPMAKLIIYVLPWPKGAPTAPEFIVRDDGDLKNRVAALREAVEKFAARGESETIQPHAAFGTLSHQDWGALQHRHLEHHLKQFNA